ncbi:MAG: glucokinase [Candidatus Electrothrix sp. Rat3]|nr:glucokinase [Candidatus Electrothrix rattekaaiensis]
MSSLLLAGDIGATKTVLALYDTNNSLLTEKTFRNKDFSGLSDIIASFLDAQEKRPKRACFGVAGPVRENRVRMTNLDWDLDGSALAAQLGMEEVLLVNDLVATTAGAVLLPKSSLVTLNQGRPEVGGNIGVLAVGTGLGQSFAVPLLDKLGNNQFQPFPTEGGHVSFAPRNQEQIEILQFMLRRLEQQREQQELSPCQSPYVNPHVSVEQVCSGMALPDLYTFQLTRCSEPEWMRKKRLAIEPDALSPLIVASANAAVSGAEGLPCEPAVRAVQLLLDILAAETANFTLKVLATGGIFLGGGMLPRLLTHIDQERFMETFCRGVYRDMLADIPVHIITEPKTALLGARQLAMKTEN